MYSDWFQQWAMENPETPHDALMKAHRNRKEIDRPKSIDCRPASSKFAVCHVQDRVARVILEVPGHGYLVLRVNEDLKDPLGRLDEPLGCFAMTEGEAVYKER